MNNSTIPHQLQTLVTRQAPDFTATAVVNGEFKKVSLADYRGKFVILVFYPLDFTFVCPTELIAFNDRIEEFSRLNAEVIGISVDSEYSHLAWAKMPRKDGGLGGINLTLVSDLDKSIAARYGVLFENSVSLRGLFIIDHSGKVRHCTINELGIGRSVDETLRLVRAIKFTDEHGEVCPANWDTGSKAMKADPRGSQEYFRSVNE